MAPTLQQYKIDESDPEWAPMHATVASWGLTRNDGQRLDAGETATIVRQLLYVKARTYDIKYAQMKARDFIPVSHEVPSGAETWSYQTWDMVGMAKIIVNYATDFPKVEVQRKETIQQIKSLGAGYDYSIQDMRRVQMMAGQGGGGGQLDTKKAAAAKLMIERAIDEIAAVGSPDAGFMGFINNPSVPVVAAPIGNWAIATALQMIGDLNTLVSKIVTTTLETELPDTLLLATFEFNQISQTPFSTLSDRTVAEWFHANNPWIQEMDSWVKLGKANAGGTGGRTVCYSRDPEKLTLEIPQEFEQFQPQMEGMVYSIPCHARIGGTAFYYPLSAAYMDGTS